MAKNHGISAISVFVIAVSGLLLSACGIPQFSIPPANIALTKTDVEVFVNVEPTSLEETQGLLVLYKIYNQSDSGATYSVEQPVISSYLNGQQAHSDLIRRGYRTISVQGDGASVPTISFADFPTLFSDSQLGNGISSSASFGVSIQFDTISDMTINFTGAGGSLIGSRVLQRNLGAGSDRGFEYLIDEYQAGDDDVPDSFASGDDLELSIVVFGYRGSFGEGAQYSKPGFLTPSNVFLLTSP